MSATNPSPSAPRLLLLVALCAVTSAALSGYQISSSRQEFARLGAELAARDSQLQLILGEVTRLRIEQSTGRQGPAALIEKLQTYAPLLASSRTTQPDYESARKEMDAVLRAFASLGHEAWQPLVARMDGLRGDQDFDQLKWLLEAATRIDKPAATTIVKLVLQGLKFPAPRLRWYAARMLIDLDKPVAQAALRQILLTESGRGINLERAAAYGATVPDQAAYATTGFHNFIQYYVLSEDPQLEQTLLMLLGRTEHDTITLQECIEALGQRESAAAVEPIQKLFSQPPGQVANPLFLVKCLDALASIQGEAARPFFEQALPKANTELVANHLKRLLGKPIQKGAMKAATLPATAPQPTNSIAPPGKK